MIKKLFQNSKFGVISAFGLLTLMLMVPSQAFAGFEWTPPRNIVPPATSNQVVIPPPIAPNAPLEPLAPIPPSTVPSISSPPVINTVQPPPETESFKVMTGPAFQVTPDPLPIAPPAPASVQEPVPPPDVNTSLRRTRPPLTPEQKSMVTQAVPIVPPVFTAPPAVAVPPPPLPAPTLSSPADRRPERSSLPGRVSRKIVEPVQQIPVPPSFNDRATPPVATRPIPAPSQDNLVPITPVVPASSINSGSLFEDAIGFGKDLPLAMAVRQIVPSNYAVSYQGDIDAEAEVSWEGGRPWNLVLNNLLDSQGLESGIAGKQVTIQKIFVPSPVIESPRVPQAIAERRSAPPPTPTQEPLPVREVSALSGPIIEPRPLAHQKETMSVDVTKAMLQEAGYGVRPEPPAPISVPPTSDRAFNISISSKTVLNPDEQRLWQGQKGTTLRTLLSQWSSQAGVELHWSSEYDFPLESSVRLNGTFQEAVQTLLTGLRDAQPRPIGRLHPNLPEGPSVLIVSTRFITQ